MNIMFYYVLNKNLALTRVIPFKAANKIFMKNRFLVDLQNSIRFQKCITILNEWDSGVIEIHSVLFCDSVRSIVELMFVVHRSFISKTNFSNSIKIESNSV